MTTPFDVGGSPYPVAQVQDLTKIVDDLFVDLEAYLKAQLTKVDVLLLDDPTAARVMQQARLTKLIQQAGEQLDAVGSALTSETLSAQAAAAAQSATDVLADVKTAVGTPPPDLWVRIAADWTDLPLAAINAIVLSSATDVGKLYAKFSQEARTTLRKTLVRAIGAGASPEDAAAQLSRSLQLPKGRALTIARSEILRAYRHSTSERFKANPDVLKGWYWHANLSGPPCLGCLSQHGRLRPLDERMDSHPNCRCAMVPATKSWAEISPKYAKRQDTTVQLQTGDAWLREQADKVQREVLGERYKAFAQGASLDAFVTRVEDEWGVRYEEIPLATP